jgi:hypothetical protein
MSYLTERAALAYIDSRRNWFRDLLAWFRHDAISEDRHIWWHLFNWPNMIRRADLYATADGRGYRLDLPGEIMFLARRCGDIELVPFDCVAIMWAEGVCNDLSRRKNNGKIN